MTSRRISAKSNPSRSPDRPALYHSTLESLRIIIMMARSCSVVPLSVMMEIIIATGTHPDYRKSVNYVAGTFSH